MIEPLSLPTMKRQPPKKETPKAAAAFRAYCDLGPDRSLRKLANSSSTKLAQLGVWSSMHHWQDRVKEYDAVRAEEKRRKRASELEKMDEEHALIGHTQVLRAVALIKEHIDRSDTTLASAVTLLRAGYELERLARGAATSRLEGDIMVLVQPKEYIGIDENSEGADA